MKTMKFFEIEIRLRAVAVTALLAIGLATSAQAVVIGAPATNGNCFPFGCGDASTTRYQQVYDDTQFGGPLTISTIRFFQTLNTSGNLNSGTYTLRLSHSANPVDALDTVNFNSNVGADDALFGTFVLAGGPVVGGTLEFTGTPFFYDGVGDLLLDISANITLGGSTFLDARVEDAGGVFSRAHNFGIGFEGYGLVTEFAGGTAPEPGTLALLGLGLAGLAAARRRKQ